MELEVQTLDERIFQTLGITNRRGYDPHLGNRVVPVVMLPLAGADSGVDSTFNDGVTEAGEAFSARSTAGPAAGVNSSVQLWNPLASGKALYVDGVDFIHLTATDRIEMRSATAALATLVGSGFNQNLGSSPSAAELRIAAAAAAGTVIQEGCSLVNVAYQWKLDSPIRIPPGRGLTVCSFAVNVLVVATFRWREKSTT